MKYLICTIAATSLLSACGNGSGIGNSGNSAGSANGSGSFGLRARAEEPVVPMLPQVVETRELVPVVKSAVLDRSKGGSILRVVGDTGVLGYYDLELVESKDSTPELLVYEFRASPPSTNRSGPTERSNQVQAAVFVSDFTISSANAVLIRAAQNTIIVRR